MNKDFIQLEVKKIHKDILTAVGFGWLIVLGLAVFTFLTPNHRYLISGIQINSWITVGIVTIIVVICTFFFLFRLIRGQKDLFKLHHPEATLEQARQIINDEVSQIKAEICLSPAKNSERQRIVIMPTYSLIIDDKIQTIPTADIYWIRTEFESSRSKSNLIYRTFTKSGVITTQMHMDRQESIGHIATVMPQIESHFPNVFAHLTDVEQDALARKFDKDYQGFIKAYNDAKTD